MFTAVAWATYGVGGRAVILAVVTALMLIAPLVALRRGLTATAETFAAVGLLLVGLDGYAAWYVNLFGVAGGSGPRYAGTVALVTAVVAAGYGALTRLTGPTVVALLTIQPVIPLLAGPVHPDAAGWSLIFAAVATLNLIIVARPVRRVRRVPEPSTARTVVRQTLGWALFGVAVALAGLGAGIAELMVRDAAGAALAGLAVITVAAVVAGAAAVSRADVPRSLAATFAVLAVTLAVGVYVAVLRPSLALATVAAAVAGVAALAQATGRLAARSSLPGPPAPTHPDAGDGGRSAPANLDAGPAAGPDGGWAGFGRPGGAQRYDGRGRDHRQCARPGRVRLDAGRRRPHGRSGPARLAVQLGHRTVVHLATAGGHRAGHGRRLAGAGADQPGDPAGRRGGHARAGRARLGPPDLVGSVHCGLAGGRRVPAGGGDAPAGPRHWAARPRPRPFWPYTRSRSVSPARPVRPPSSVDWSSSA